MGKFFTKGRIACLIIFSVLVIDQIIKIWIKIDFHNITTLVFSL